MTRTKGYLGVELTGTYDPKCYALAEAFLSDEPELNNAKNIHTLALEIQRTIDLEIELMNFIKEKETPQCRTGSSTD